MKFDRFSAFALQLRLKDLVCEIGTRVRVLCPSSHNFNFEILNYFTKAYSEFPTEFFKMLRMPII